jgi:flagellin
VNTQSQIAAYVNFVVNGSISNGQLLRIDNGNGGYVDFTFATTASANTDIQIGATTEETLQNVVKTLSQYSGTNDYGVRQLTYAINGNTLTISNQTTGNPTSLSGSNLAIATTVTNASLSSSSFNNGTATGVNVSGINNAAFRGSVSGFRATYNSADNITLSLVVGDSTYSATISDTTPAGATTVRLTSTSGGYLDVQLAAGGAAVTNQTTADTFASRLNAAFSGLTFYNDRSVSNFSAVGSFIGGSARLQLRDFTDVRIDGITVNAPLSAGLDGTIDITINGTIFRASSGVGGRLGAYETLRFTSLDNANEFLELTNGATAQNFTDSTTAATFLTALRTSFGVDEEGSGVNFQIGSSPEDFFNVVVNNVRTDRLFAGSTPSINTQANAALAQDAIETASNLVQEIIAKVGAQQERFNGVSTAIASSLTGLGEAKSNLVDTDIAEESTQLALATLKVNSAIAVIAQAQNIQSHLLNTLQFGGK